jgi:hypothetical protein
MCADISKRIAAPPYQISFLSTAVLYGCEEAERRPWPAWGRAVVSHGVSCIWYAAGDDEQTLPGPNGVVLLGWVRARICAAEAGADGNCWDEEVSLATRYLDALYYSLTTITTVGYGDRTPTTDVENRATNSGARGPSGLLGLTIPQNSCLPPSNLRAI